MAALCFPISQKIPSKLYPIPENPDADTVAIAFAAAVNNMENPQIMVDIFNYAVTSPNNPNTKEKEGTEEEVTEEEVTEEEVTEEEVTWARVLSKVASNVKLKPKCGEFMVEMRNREDIDLKKVFKAVCNLPEIDSEFLQILKKLASEKLAIELHKKRKENIVIGCLTLGGMVVIFTYFKLQRMKGFLSELLNLA